jgi:hypothetical protein
VLHLYWLVHRIDGEPKVYVQESSSLIEARLKAGLVGVKGEYVEGHELDDKTARKVPKDMRQRVLSGIEAARLLKRMK